MRRWLVRDAGRERAVALAGVRGDRFALQSVSPGMVSSRTATALVGLAVSLAVSALAWYYLNTFLLFLFVPFVPFLFSGRGDGAEPGVRTCPRCVRPAKPASQSVAAIARELRSLGPFARRNRAKKPPRGFRTRDASFEYCPRDGTRLE